MTSLFRRAFLACALALAALAFAGSARAQNPMVRVHTTAGPIDMSLLAAEAPRTVANFLAYVRGGDYTDVFFHRNAWLATMPPVPFVIQSGGYRWPEGTCCPAVSSRGAVANEFSAARSNVVGTVAMAKIGGDPDSATSQWFINMRDNSANLDTQNGGFTVFARVTAPTLATASRIAALQAVNAPPFTELPVTGWQSGTPIQRHNVVRITAVTEFPAQQSASDRIFNYLEAMYPQYTVPSQGSPGEALGYVFRHYGGSGVYVGTKDGKVWYLTPAQAGTPGELGSVADWLAAAQAAGY